MSKSTYLFRLAGQPKLVEHEGDDVIEKGSGTFEVRKEGERVAEVANVEWHTISIQLTYDEIWEYIDQNSREHLELTGEEFMKIYFTDPMSLYHKSIFRTLCHMADLIDEEYQEIHGDVHSPKLESAHMRFTEN